MPSCAGQQRGSKVSIQIDYETTFGADPGAPAGIQIPYINESLNGSRSQNQSEVIDGSKNPTPPFQGNTDVGGDITVPIDQRYFAYWMKALLGPPTTTGAGPYTHVFKVDDTICNPSLVVQKDFSDVPRFFKYNGVKIASMSMSIGGDGEPQATFSLVGASVSDSASDYDATPTTHVLEIFRPTLDVTLNEGGSASAEFTELSIDVDSNLDTDTYAIGGGGNRTAIADGVYSMGGSGVILFDNMTIYDKGRDATESSIEVIYARGTSSLTIDFNEIEYGQNSPLVSGNEGVNLNMDWIAYDGDDAANSAMVVTIVNDVASYA
jgi:hypothetical protein